MGAKIADFFVTNLCDNLCVLLVQWYTNLG